MNNNRIELFLKKTWLLKVVIGSLLLLNLIGIIQPFFDNEIKYIIRVKPKTETVLSTFPKSEVHTSGILIINNPDFIDRMLYRTNETSSLTTSIIYFLILILLFRHSGSLNFNDKEVFKKNIWKILMLIGLLLFFLSWINIFKDFIIQKQINKYTNDEFNLDEKFTHWAQFWAAMILITFGGVMKRALKLQQEQDLTV